MAIDTTHINQRMTHFDAHPEIWLFGYGSLICKADFSYLERRLLPERPEPEPALPALPDA